MVGTLRSKLYASVETKKQTADLTVAVRFFVSLLTNILRSRSTARLIEYQVSAQGNQRERPKPAHHEDCRNARQHKDAAWDQRPPVLLLKEPYQAEAEAQKKSMYICAKAVRKGEVRDDLPHSYARQNSAGY